MSVRCLQRRVAQLRAVLLLRGDALELVPLAALLAAHAEVAIHAAQRQPPAGHLLEKRLRSRHAVGVDGR